MSANEPTESQSHATEELPGTVALVAAQLTRLLGGSLIGIYLYGSYLTSRLHAQSDIDLLVLVDKPITGATRLEVVAELLKLSGWNAVDSRSRPLDIAFVVLGDVVPWRFPPQCDLMFGEWLRDDLASQRIAPSSDRPDLAILLSSLLRHNLKVLGPVASTVLPAVPPEDLKRSGLACLPSLLRNLRGDERNVILTLARMWVTLATGEIVSKDAAAEWALARAPADVTTALKLARDAYLGVQADDWSARAEEADVFVSLAVDRIQAFS
jgi:aminoglycoside 9-adenylyltransferase